MVGFAVSKDGVGEKISPCDSWYQPWTLCAVKRQSILFDVRPPSIKTFQTPSGMPLMLIDPLLVVLLGLVVDDVEELELVHSLRGGDDTEPVTELLLLEELLGATGGLSATALEYWRLG